MNVQLQKILDWSEVWALLIPLAIMLIYKNKTSYLRPVRIYVWSFLFLNLFIDLIAEYKWTWGIRGGDFLWSNNFLYNVGSVLRLLLFAWFFNGLQQHFMHTVKKLIPYVFIFFVLTNFIFFEDFFYPNSFSSRLLATEAGILLFFCLQYFIYQIIEDRTTSFKNQPGFWVVIGLSIYVAANFFIFLFYEYLSDAKRNFAIGIWDVHNYVFILLCIFIGVQFLQEAKSEKKWM
jgi:hypothetical protein